MLEGSIRRYEAALAAIPKVHLRPAHALRQAFAKGYSAQTLKADLLAGIVVGVVALPLSMALAIATGVPPQHGLYTAIVAGALIALLGGSHTQVSGPTAAFVVILTPISAQYGISGLLVATVLAGIFLVGLGLFRMGKLIEFIPYPVTAGFTAGIGVVIATLQLKDFFGLTMLQMPDHYIDRVVAIARAMPSFHASDLVIGVFTLAILILFPRITRQVPSPLVAIGASTILAVILARFAPQLSVATIGSRFSFLQNGQLAPGIPSLPPMPVLPWSLSGPGGEPLGLSFGLLRALAPSAFAIAMLGGIESLLSAVVADGMARTKHDPDAELVAQGVGNIVAPFFGGFAATGAIARTATNIRAGARSPIAAVTHALFVLIAMLVLAPLLAFLPMAAMAALLLLVAWNMSEAKHVIHVLRVAPKSDVAVLLTCFSLTIVFDMVVGVSVGVVLASLLFMQHMASLAEATLAEGHHLERNIALPPGVVLYEIGGPLFFGAAQKAMSALDRLGSHIKVVILDLEDVPTMDATGLVNLESALDRIHHAGASVMLAGLQEQPATLLERAGICQRYEQITLCDSVERAIELSSRVQSRPPAAVAGL